MVNIREASTDEVARYNVGNTITSNRMQRAQETRNIANKYPTNKKPKHSFVKFKGLHGIKMKQFKSRHILRKTGTPVIVENQPVYTSDKNRFFNDSVEEERRQLFFSWDIFIFYTEGWKIDE